MDIRITTKESDQAKWVTVTVDGVTNHVGVLKTKLPASVKISADAFRRAVKWIPLKK
jgi:hypothetical protein